MRSRPIVYPYTRGGPSHHQITALPFGDAVPNYHAGPDAIPAITLLIAGQHTSLVPLPRTPPTPPHQAGSRSYVLWIVCSVMAQLPLITGQCSPKAHHTKGLCSRGNVILVFFQDCDLYHRFRCIYFMLHQISQACYQKHMSTSLSSNLHY